MACAALVAVAGLGDHADAEAGRGRRHRHAAADRELSPAELGWPPGTRSLRAPGVLKVYREPGHSERWGKLAPDTRVRWKRIVARRYRGCAAWAEIEPRGWVCARELAPSTDEPAPSLAVDPAGIVERILATPYLAVAPLGARVFASLADAARGRAKGPRLGGWTFLRLPLATATLPAGVQLHRTRRGYVAAADTIVKPASPLAGVVLDARTALPLAWIDARAGEVVAVRGAPAPTAPQRGTRRRRDVVRVRESRDGFVRIGEDREWIARRALRIARQMTRPAGVREDERWIDVDLDEQTLVAYEGDVPVFATLISTGKGASTPTAVHRIRKKHALTRMKSPDVALGRWDMPDVPFALTFRKYYAVHTAYWHDGFGAPRSQGCVNLAPRDARWLFDWTLPHVPAGWIEGSAYGDEGTPIRLRSARDPDPGWVDHDAPPPVPTRLSSTR